MPFAVLEDRALITVSGPEAEHFLQNILTSDLDQLGDGQAKPSALLTPQGKILFDFLISRAGLDAFRLECRADVADDFVRRLTLYRLRAKVQIAKQDQVVVAAVWGSDSTSPEIDPAPSENSSIRVVDTRFKLEPVFRVYGLIPPSPLGGGIRTAPYAALRIASGIAESGSDYALGDAFPHDVLLDEIGGVGFKKGCYVGQEVVSRMQHRGTARRRVLLASADLPLPASGTELLVDGRPVGTLGSVAGHSGLVIARIDRVKAALDAGNPIMADNVPVSLVIPAWAKFTFPQEPAGAGEA